MTWRSKGVVARSELRAFIGQPKHRQWKALLKRAGLDSIPMETNSGGSWLVPRHGFTLAECRALLRLRYAELGERLLKKKR